MTLNGGGFGSDLRLTGAGPTSQVVLAAGQTLATTGTAIISNITLDNLGTVALADTYLNNGAVLNNDGIMNIANGFLATSAGTGTFNNNGMLKNTSADVYKRQGLSHRSAGREQRHHRFAPG